jgi:hypothetical protein
VAYVVLKPGKNIFYFFFVKTHSNNPRSLSKFSNFPEHLQIIVFQQIPPSHEALFCRKSYYLLRSERIYIYMNMSDLGTSTALPRFQGSEFHIFRVSLPADALSRTFCCRNIAGECFPLSNWVRVWVDPQCSTYECVTGIACCLG